MRKVRAEAKFHVRPRGEGAKAVDVDLDASLDDARHQALDQRLFVERLLDRRFGAFVAPRMVGEDDQAAASTVVVHDADEVRAHLEDDARDLWLAQRLGNGDRRGSVCVGRLVVDGSRRRLGWQGGFRGRRLLHRRVGAFWSGDDGRGGPLLWSGRGRRGIRLVVGDEHLASVEDRVRLAGDVDEDRVVGDGDDLAEDDVAPVDGRALARRTWLALLAFGLLLGRLDGRVVRDRGARGLGPFGRVSLFASGACFGPRGGGAVLLATTAATALLLALGRRRAVGGHRTGVPRVVAILGIVLGFGTIRDNRVRFGELEGGGTAAALDRDVVLRAVLVPVARLGRGLARAVGGRHRRPRGRRRQRSVGRCRRRRGLLLRGIRGGHGQEAREPSAKFRAFPVNSR